MTASITHRDIISTLAGIEAASPLAALRAQRPEAMVHAQGSYDALFDPAEMAGLSQVERLTVARQVAEAHASQPAVAHFRARLAVTGDSTALREPRAPSMRRHADLLSTRPADASPDDLEALADAGLSTREIVSLSQVIAFVSFFVRVLAALEALGADPPSEPVTPERTMRNDTARATKPAAIIRPPNDLKRPPAFTVDQLAWTAWLQPLDLASATPAQLGALEGDRARSAYFRLLALDPEVLVERTATDRGIFYTHGGAPRADRELAAAATSRLNGCIYCTSVHAARAAQLSKRDADIDRLLRLGVQPVSQLELDERWQAIVDASVALARTPTALTRDHVATLRAAGLHDLEILDVLQAGAFFAWANRLMLTLGEPYYAQV